MDLTSDIFYVPPPLSCIPGLQALATASQTTTVVQGGITAFVRTDRAFGSPMRILVRQLDPVADLGEEDPSSVRSPQWFRLEAPRDVRPANATAFRDELRIQHYPRGLRFDISVADEGRRIRPQPLHFAHPQWRTSLGRVGLNERANDLVAGAVEWSESSRDVLEMEGGIEQALAALEALQGAQDRVRTTLPRRQISSTEGSAADRAIGDAVASLAQAQSALVDDDLTGARE